MNYSQVLMELVGCKTYGKVHRTGFMNAFRDSDPQGLKSGAKECA